MKKSRKKYRIHGVISEVTGLPCVWIGTTLDNPKNPEAIYTLKNIYGEKKEVFKSDCKFS